MLTKAEIARLPAEDQETLAQLELSKVQQRQQLLKEVLGHGDSWHSYLGPILVMIFCTSAFIFLTFQEEKENGKLGFFLTCAVLGLTVLISAIQAHTDRINRRLDALLKLLEMDHKLQNEDEGTNEKKIG